MNRAKHVLAALALVMIPLLALSSPTADELEQNHQKLMKLRSQPEEFERLRRQARYFLALPPEKRAHILRLDQEINKEPAWARIRLHNVLRRYGAWLDRLDPADRKKIEDAPSKQARLETIRSLREADWLKKQPRAVRAELAGLEGDKLARKIQQLRHAETRRRQEWQIASAFWGDLVNNRPLPARLTEFPQEVQNYVHDYLEPLLSPNELANLNKAQGHWPLYPRTLVTMADRHPQALPGARGPSRFSELPSEVKREMNKRFKKGKGMISKMALKALEGRWPDFARAVSRWAKIHKLVFPQEFWPYGYQCLSPPAQQFVQKTLQPVLTPDEKLALAHAEGKWPDYPKTVQRLASSHNLTVPWQTLPGAANFWEKYRIMAASSR